MSYSIQMHDAGYDKNKGWRQLSASHEKQKDATKVMDQFERKYMHRTLRMINDQSGRTVMSASPKVPMASRDRE